MVRPYASLTMNEDKPSLHIKIIGFKVGVSRPTYNKTLMVLTTESGSIIPEDKKLIGLYVGSALERSDFLSIRKV